MATTPDLSKIVEVIMQNPELITTISSLITSSSDSTEVHADDNAEATREAPSSEAVASPINAQAKASATPTEPHSARSPRRELLGALKPYLSENRRAAIDSMITISDVLSMMKGR